MGDLPLHAGGVLHYATGEAMSTTRYGVCVGGPKHGQSVGAQGEIFTVPTFESLLWGGVKPHLGRYEWIGNIWLYMGRKTAPEEGWKDHG